jgi:23S rRNA (cytosine1962-C5)-methyltransferase
MDVVARVSKRGAARWVVAQHPWIYRSDVTERPASDAGVVRVVDTRGRDIGMALWSPASEIALRMLTRDAAVVDAGFWAERVVAARAYRDVGLPGAAAARIIHGEADGMPSLIVDRYGEQLVVQLLSAGLEACRAEVLDALRAVLAPAGVLARHDVAVRAREGLARDVELLHGEVPDLIEVREGAVSYLAAPREGQKTGAFLDQRLNRMRAGELARGRVLDCFSYHGSFALHLAVRADETWAVDMSATALARARANAELNGFAPTERGDVLRHTARSARLRLVEANAFDLLRELDAAGERFDVIVLDPPAFAKRKSALPAALRGYKELNLRALKLLNEGGHLCTFSCSFHVRAPLFRRMLEEAAADARRPVRWREWRGASPDHPEIMQIPETGYLKGAILEAV